MSFINGSPLAGMGATPAFEFERSQNESASQNAASEPFRAMPQYGDGFRSNPIALPVSDPNQNAGGYDGGSGYGGFGSAGSADGSFLNGIMNSLNALMQQLASYFGSSSASGTAAGTGYTNAPAQTAPQETAYTSATASSWGDPHDSFGGTTAAGATVSDKWDSMNGHGDLLDSDSFRGGYRVSTSVTAPNANGVTYNAGATVATQGGNDSVTLDKDGSYKVTENGKNVTLAQGQATDLGHGETVTLNADKSLTIVDTNQRGGSLTTTLSENGNGVDVNASGTNVDLGGYLVDKTDRDAEPSAYAPASASQQYGGYAAQQQTQATQYQQFLSEMQQTPYQYAGSAEPLGAGELEFA